MPGWSSTEATFAATFDVVEDVRFSADLSSTDGGTQEAAADAAGVPVYALAEITQAEIDEVRADLKEMGWLD